MRKVKLQMVVELEYESDVPVAELAERLQDIMQSASADGRITDNLDACLESMHTQVLERPSGEVKYVRAAMEMYDNDEVNIDDDARVSLCEDGAFVQAWVYVNDEEVDKTPEFEMNPENLKRYLDIAYSEVRWPQANVDSYKVEKTGVIYAVYAPPFEEGCDGKLMAMFGQEAFQSVLREGKI